LDSEIINSIAISELNLEKIDKISFKFLVNKICIIKRNFCLKDLYLKDRQILEKNISIKKLLLLPRFYCKSFLSEIAWEIVTITLILYKKK